MDDDVSCPLPATQAAEAQCGPGLTVELITDRRGSSVWHATGSNGQARIKAGRDIGAAITSREAEVMRRLSGYNAVSGSDGDTHWYVSSWHTGPSTWDRFTRVREHKTAEASAIEAAVELTRAVAALHDEGWVHSDLQPSHGIHTTGGVKLIDLAWAWRDGFEQSPLFRGGIVHLLAPELAAAITRNVRPVRPKPAAEVYALAGTLWTCTTGRWPLDYDGANADPTLLGPDALRKLIANRLVPIEQVAVWPQLQDALLPVLLSPSYDRPTAAELAEILEQL